jgi:hypothetical protein
MRRIGDKTNAPVDASLTWKGLTQKGGLQDVHRRPFKVPQICGRKTRDLEKLGALELANVEEVARDFTMSGYCTYLLTPVNSRSYLSDEITCQSYSTPHLPRGESLPGRGREVAADIFTV